MIKTFLNVLIFLFCINVYGQEKYSKKELTEDIQYLFKTIKEGHIDPYFYSKDIDTICQSIISGLPNQMDKDSFQHYLTLQTSNLWDIHTGITNYYFVSKVSDSSKLIPNNFIIKDSSLLLVQGNKKLQVNNINGISSKLILDRFYKYTKADMSPIIKQRFVEKYFSLMFNAEFKGFSKFEICCGQNAQIIALQPVRCSDLYKPFGSRKDFDSCYFQKYSLAYLIINTFEGNRLNDLNLFLASSFKKIDSLKIQSLIVDIRLNGGGSDNCANALLDYIFNGDYSILYGFNRTKDSNGNIQNGSYTWERKSKQEHVFNGKFLLLQSTQTASAAMDFSSAIKTSHRGLIVGEPTMDPVYSFANAKSFEMPNSKMGFRCAQGFYAMPGSNANVNSGVIPDLYYNFENDNINLEEMNKIIKLAKEYYKGYFYFDYKN